jgi:hypothetical protein
VNLERDQFECLPPKLYNKKLANKDTNNNGDEQIVIEELSEDINFLFL